MKGFTVVELLVSVGIFTVMTALLVANYGNFNQSVLLTNTAYDVALAIRTAQTYGVGVKAAPQEGLGFEYPYGVAFNANSGSLILFADSDSNPGVYQSGDVSVTTYLLKRGAKISTVCAGTSSDSCTSGTALNVTYKRPDPSAIICLSTCPVAGYAYAEIVIQATDGSTRKVGVYKNGQIAVLDQ